MALRKNLILRRPRTIRHMTLNLLQRTKTVKKKSVRVKRGLAALDEAFLQSVLMAA